jgi:hypothetical protein
MPDIPVITKVKSFWERPEGKTGMLFAGLGIGGGLLIMAKWGAALVAAAQNTLVLGGYIIAAAAIGYILMDPRFRATVFYMYKGLMRFITGLFVQIDPIGILKTYIEDLKKNHEKMNAQISKLRGTMRTLKEQILSNEREARDQMAIASQAQKAGKQAQMVLRTRKAGRLEQSNRSYKDLLRKMEVIYRVLSKMYENCGILIEDTDDQIKQKEIEWKTIKQAHGAMKSAMAIISGDKDKRAIYEEALDIMANDLGNKIGEMERFMELSENFMDGLDLQNGVFEEKGMEMLEKWEKDADSWVLGSEKGQIIADANDDSKVLDLDAVAKKPEPHANTYGKLFE